MKRSILAIATALFLVALLAPAALAAGDTAPAAETSPAAEPTVTPLPTPTPVQGEVVIDPTFISDASAPAGEVAGATGRPEVTPPSTDTITAATTSGTGLRVLLVLGVVGSFLAVLVGQLPGARRR